MKAHLEIDLQTSSPTEAQRTLLELGEKLKQDGIIGDYRFEIETPAGPVSERCILKGERVIA